MNFGAVFVGKFKMGFQSATILLVLIYVNYARNWQPSYEQVARWVRDFAIWGTVLITAYSGLAYVQKAVVLFRHRPNAEAGAGDDD